MNDIKENQNEQDTNLTGLEIAVIGMSGRFPGAINLDEFWENIRLGKETVSHFSDSELLEYGVTPELLKNPNYVKTKGVMEGIELFDAHFFGYSPREAQGMDPQIRIMHECVWHALEDAGIDPELYEGMIGLYAGASTDVNWVAQAIIPRSTDNLEFFDNLMYGHKDLLSTLVSYRLNLRGPSYSVYTACSTSLATIHMGCRSLLTGECQVAVTGGITVTLPKKFGYLCQEGMIYSPDGHCRAFDAKADGTFFGDGVGVVVLKRFEDALADGDRVHAIVKASAANNDGRRKVGYVAPSVEGQSEAIRAALYMAEVEPESIGFVECHGTGTLVGDPIEIESLTLAFNTEKRNYCAVGAIKANVGHLHAAAGVAGFIKAVLVLKHRLLPPAVNYESPNPKIDFEQSPFYVNTELREWKRGEYPLRAGVSSFGIGGTNVHVILEEMVPPVDVEENTAVRPYRLILLSAKTENSLVLASENLRNYIKNEPRLNIDDAAYTLQTGRRSFQYRKTVVCSDMKELGEKLLLHENISQVRSENPPVVFMFSGQGSQYVNMGQELYLTEKTFRDDIDHCFRLLGSILGENCIEVLYPKTPKDNLSDLEKNRINEFIYTSPIKFIFEYALARLLMSWGIMPTAMIGHSFGEYSVACLSGVISLEDTLKLTALRGKLFHELPEGMMVSVPLPEDKLRELLTENGVADRVSVAAVNGTSQCLISGPCDLTSGIQAKLEAAGCECGRVRVPRAAHSPEMQPMVDEFRKTLEQVIFHEPSIPYISGLSGTWIKEEAGDPAYYCRHLLQTIRFYDGLTELLKKEDTVFIQIGSDRSLSAFVTQHPGKKAGHSVLNLIRHPKDDVSDERFLMEKIGFLWQNGLKIDWKAFHGDVKRSIVSLPGYAFEPIPYLNKAFYTVKIDEARPGQWEKEGEALIPSDLKSSAMEFKRPELKTRYVGPGNEIEQVITDVMQNIFGLERVGIYDSFFEMGGDSLLALKMVSLVNKALDINIPVSEIFVHPTPSELAQYISTKEGKDKSIQYPQKETDPANQYMPFRLTDVQVAYLVGREKAFELGGVSTHAYSELETRMDIGRLNDALNKVIARHPMLRAIIVSDNQQIVLKEVPEFKIQEEDLSRLDYESQQERIKTERERMAHYIFKPNRWPLFEIKAFKISPDTHYICVGIDVLFSDGASIMVFARDLMSYYEGHEDLLPPLDFTFRDYIMAYEELRETDLYLRDKEYWMNKLETFPSSPALPLRCNPSEISTPHFNRCIRKFSQAQWQQIKENARSHNITPSAFLATLYVEVLAYWSNQPHLALNLSVFNRLPFHKDVNQIIGDFTSLILLDIDLRQHTTFWEKAAKVQQVLFESLEHRHYDGVEFIRDLGRHRGLTGKVIMPVIFTSVLFSGGWVDVNSVSRFGDIKVGITQASQAFIDFQASEEDGGLIINWDYVRELFEENVIPDMFDQVVTGITRMLNGDDRYELEPRQELLQMLQHYNDTDEDIPPALLHRMFEEQVLRTPFLTAVEFGDDSLTYKQLDETSNQVARYLREKGVKNNQPIAVLSHRCIETIVNVMGVLKAGGAYVPVDPDYPKDRQDYIFSNSKCPLMITPQLYREENLRSYPVEALNPVNKPDDLAYIIYTSGSTGRPKGVMETHRESSNTIIDINRKFSVNETDRILGISSMCFDLSVYDVFGALSTGAALVLISSQKDVKEIITNLIEKKITIWNSVPAILDMTLENIDFYLKKEEPAAIKEVPAQDTGLTIIRQHDGTVEEKLYHWSPSMYWKKQKSKLRIDKYYFSGVAPDVFPELYFLAQEGVSREVIMKSFPVINQEQLKLFIDDLIEKRILVDSILAPEEVFRPQGRLFRNTFTEEILYNETAYNQYKKMQLTREFEGVKQEKIDLEKNGQFPAFIKDRRSYREFDKKPIPFDIFSMLLSLFKQTREKEIRYFYASAGGLYPIDIFVYVKNNRVENLERGLYYYNPMDNTLNTVEKNLIIDEDIHFMGNKEIFRESAFTVFMMYDAGVTMPKYRENGYFYALIDCGIMVGTLTQAAELLGFGLCSIGSLDFNKIRSHFKLNENQVLMHTVELGLKPGYTPVSNEMFQWNSTQAIPGRKSLEAIQPGNMSLRLIMMSGDWIPLNLPGKIGKYFHGAEVISLGGATEGSIWSIYFPIKEVKRSWKSIPYGYPLANQQFYVLDFQGRYCPFDVPGELHIGGIGVAEGYMGDEEKTANSFIRHPKLGRLYRTGDFGVFRKEGYIEFLGRRDSQVKIRGYRIELGEIETRILEIDFIKDAVVIVKEYSGSKILCTFLVLQPGILDTPWPQVIEKLRKLLVERLPDYMIPSSFVRLDRMPVSTTGKIDRKSLASYEIELQDEEKYVAPGNEVEEKLEEIFSKILGVEKIGITENFFQLGGDSLKAIAAVTEIRKQMNIDLPLEKIFIYLTIKELAECICSEFEPVIGGAGKVDRKAKYLTAQADWENISEPFGLTNIQRAYVLGRYNYFEMGGTSTHVYQEIEARLDIERLNAGLNKLIKRHPMLRAVILDDSSQQILEEIPQYRIEVVDFTGSDPEALMQAIQKERERMSHHIFRTDTWPLFEIKAFRTGQDKYYIFIGFDLLIGDAASIYIINTELPAFYANPDLEMPELQFTFRDYILAYEGIQHLEEYEADKKYWMKMLDEFPSAPALPFKCSPSEISTPHFKRLLKTFSPVEWDKLQDTIEKWKLTNAIVLCTAYAEVMAYWSNQRYLALNLPVFNRYPFHEDVNRLVGDFTSVILLKVDSNPEDNFLAKAERVKSTLMEALEHRLYSGVEFIGELAKRNSAGMQAVMPIVFTSLFLDIREDSAEQPQDLGELILSISQTSQVFIDCQIISHKGGLNINWDYVEELFEEDVIETMFDHYIHLLQSIIEGDENPGIHPAVNTVAMYEKYNDTEEDIPPVLLHRLFIDRALSSPQLTAVEFMDERITYRELDEASNRVARYLREQGVKRNDLIGLIGERSIETIINVFGILKAGGAYVPVDPEYPEDRVNYIFKSSNCLLTIGPDLIRTKRTDSYSSDSLDIVNTPDDLAYVIYTSGSTGRPKGVIETHREAGNTIVDINQRFSVDENDRVMGISSLCFDLSVYDIFGTLGAGAALVLINTPKDVPHMLYTLDNKKVTFWNSVPAIMDLLVDSLSVDYINHHLRIVMLSGDWIPLTLPGKIKKHFPSAGTYSFGGATEASIWSIYYPIEEVKETWKSIPYGMPLANQKYYVLNYDFRLSPAGVPGELYIGGIGLASGYLNDVKKTLDSFICHPQLGNLYRTGDFGVFHKEGYIEFLGRRDQQVKIKGHRIELGEIESQLLKQPGVKEAIVLVKVKDGTDRFLCAYIVPSDEVGADFPAELRKNLSQVVPTYMVPSYFVILKEMPLNANGKIDRKKLPEPEFTRPSVETPIEEPTNEIEKKIADICKQVVQLGHIGINDNLFELGITSLDVAKINSKLRQTFNIPLPIVKMFEFSTVGSLAEYIGNELGLIGGETDSAARPDEEDESLKKQTIDKGKDRLKQRRKRPGIVSQADEN